MKHINLKKSLGLIVLSFMLPFAAMAQQVTVKGKVTDQNGEPLAAAGVVVMGLEKISFGWYMKKITPAAFFGYLAGIIVYWLQTLLLF